MKPCFPGDDCEAPDSLWWGEGGGLEGGRGEGGGKEPGWARANTLCLSGVSAGPSLLCKLCASSQVVCTATVGSELLAVWGLVTPARVKSRHQGK